jgi:hypothetical protein
VNSKVCTRCGERKKLTQFSKHKGHSDGRHSQCKVCRNEHNAANRGWRNPQIHAAAKLRTFWLRHWVIIILGGKCAHLGDGSCGGAMQIDHIKENGGAHRKVCGQKSSGSGCWSKTKQNHYYRSMLESGCVGLQVLCRRHNTIKSNKYRTNLNRK